MSTNTIENLKICEDNIKMDIMGFMCRIVTGLGPGICV
jgi:hypothetical protein